MRARSDSVSQPTVGHGLGNLPLELTSFVGRRNEVAEVKRMLSVSRLVTLTGPGGVGKTRLALKVATDVRRAFGDGVWLVELGQLKDPALLPHTLAGSVGLREQPGCRLTAALREHLVPRQLLLVLDDCEHLVEAVAAEAGSLLRFCPELRVLATSRELLGIPGEVTLSVPPLPVPDPRRPCSLPELSRFEAVRLFADRAASAVPDFDLTEDNQPAVVEICQRLDGLPLAIELAAVRLRVLSAQEIAHRLSERYQLLTTGPRAAPTRQQTLRSCIQWSYDLCSPPEQLLWARLAVFDGGFELNAAEGICAGDGLAHENMLDLVASLVDKSILVNERGAVMRYRMLESIREFGRDKLGQTGEYAALRRRHRGWYADLVARINVALGTGVVAWRQGDSQRAAELLRQSLRLKRELDEPLGSAWCLEALAWIAASEHDHRRAAALFGAATALSQTMCAPTAVYSGLVSYHVQYERQTRRALGDAGFQAAFRRGMDLSVDDAIGYALNEKPHVVPSPVKAEMTLTHREREVAQLVAQGMSNSDIAARLVVSRRTAEAHVEHILLKLGFNSRAQIAVWVTQRSTDDQD